MTPFAAMRFRQKPAAGGAGVLSASVVKSLANVNIATLGTQDFMAWMSASATPAIRKTGGTGIGTLSLVGGSAWDMYDDDIRVWSWSGATPSTPTQSTHGTYNNEFVVGRGYSLTCAADTTQRVLRIYGGCYESSARYTISLSDGSATTIVDNTSVAAALSTTEGTVVTITFKAASAGQTLTFTADTIAMPGGANFPNVTISAASLGSA